MAAKASRVGVQDGSQSEGRGPDRSGVLDVGTHPGSLSYGNERARSAAWVSEMLALFYLYDSGSISARHDQLTMNRAAVVLLILTALVTHAHARRLLTQGAAGFRSAWHPPHLRCESCVGLSTPHLCPRMITSTTTPPTTTKGWMTALPTSTPTRMTQIPTARSANLCQGSKLQKKLPRWG